MRGFYVVYNNQPGVVHELRDGDYPLCGVGANAKQPVIRTEKPVDCPRCERCLSKLERKANEKLWCKERDKKWEEITRRNRMMGGRSI